MLAFLFLSILLYISLVPLFYIMSKRFLERGLVLSHMYVSEFNTGILCIICLLLSIIAFYKVFNLNNWCFFIVDFEYLLMLFSPVITISIVALGCLIFVTLVIFFESVRCEEYLVLLYVLVFIICVVSSFDFISVFVILECVNICTYVLIASGTSNIVSIYSSLKYVMMTIASTCFLLIGIVLLYLEYSHFNFVSLNITFTIVRLLPASQLTLFSITCLFVSLLIKLGVFPFYKWLIDVFGGFNTRSVLLVSTLLKVSSVVVLLNLVQTLGVYSLLFGILFKFIGLSSMFLGGLGAIFEWKFNRFVAFAGLFSMGTIFLIIFQPQYTTNIAIFFYMLIYNISVVYLVIFFKSFSIPNDRFVFLISQPNIYQLCPVTSVGHLSNIYSLINLPPFAGFYPKLLIAFLLYLAGDYFVLVCMLLFSMLSVIFFIKLYIVYFMHMKSIVSLDILNTVSLKLKIFSVWILVFNIVTMCIGIYIILFYI